MYIEELKNLGIPEDLIESLKNLGYTKLYPTQERAIEQGLLGKRNMIICTPTASGKTLMALIASIKYLEKGGKVLYICPLRSIASEKFEEISRIFSYKYRVALSIGDYDSSDPWLQEYDFIISTYEKADSLLRHKANWIKDVLLFIIDEIHMINTNRGPTLEFLIARLKKANSFSRFLALSATVNNVEEIASWLSANMLVDDWRPVPLKEGVYKKGKIKYKDGSEERIKEISNVPYIDLVLDTVEKGGQALVFNSSRASSVRVASRIGQFLSKFLSSNEKDILRNISSKIEENDNISQNLKNLILDGVAFHHAGLSYTSRKIIEDEFRKGNIKVISSTTTLGAGVNVPARRVVINEISRYEPLLGYSQELSVNEYKQLAGRAGRPKYDPIGEAILIAKGNYDEDYLMKNYILADYEPVQSQIKDEKNLRSHILSIIANNVANNETELKEILGLTFASVNFGSDFLMRLSSKVIKFLIKERFIVAKEDNFVATLIGKRVTELYIDPLSASLIIKGLQYLSSRHVNNMDFALLFLICSTEDAQIVNVNRYESDRLLEEIERYVENDTLYPFPDINSLEYDDTLSRYKTARIIYDWINEEKEDIIADKYGIGLGDLFNIIQTSKWLTYSASEISKILNLKDFAKRLSILESRISAGVKDELLELVQIPSIGRYKARILYKSGYRSIEDLKKVKDSDLLSLPSIGEETLKQIKKFLAKL